jgi:hypothetical protein
VSIRCHVSFLAPFAAILNPHFALDLPADEPSARIA